MAKLYPGDDKILLKELQQSSEEAFNKIYDKYWSMVYDDALRRLKSHAQAQDITQNIFIQLWRRRSELNIENLKAYLRVSVRNRVLNVFEKERRYVPFEQILYNMRTSEEADALAIQNEFLAACEALVNELPAKRQKIFRYHFEDGLTTEEIARQLQLSRKTVQNQLGSAVSSLRAGLTHFVALIIIFF